MEYLIIEKSGSKIVSAKELESVVNFTGKIRIFRLCGLNDPKELYVKQVGRVWILRDKYGNVEVL